ncbi:MAG: glycosyltransferase family 2 protein [Candidatus Zixiibacteriota bacterium]
MRKVLVITINYKNSQVTRALIQSLETCENSDGLHLIVVNNESNTNGRRELNSLKNSSSLSIQLLHLEKNLYYWGGAAFALESLKLDFTVSPDWIIICNNDILIEQKDFFTRLLAMDIEQYPIIAPGIISSKTQKNLNPFLINPISKMQDLYYRLYYWNKYTAKTVHFMGRRIKKLRQWLSTGIKPEDELKIYAPHGSFIIFSRHYFLQGGFLDTGFTFFGEEISVAEIARRLDLPVYYVPGLKIIHNEHMSLSKPAWEVVFNHSKKSYEYLKQKYRSSNGGN